MEIFEALSRSVKLYLAIGLIVSVVHAVAIQVSPGESGFDRATAVAQDVVLWPRFLIGIAAAVDERLAMMPIEDQPFLYSLLRGPFGSADQP